MPPEKIVNTDRLARLDSKLIFLDIISNNTTWNSIIQNDTKWYDMKWYYFWCVVRTDVSRDLQGGSGDDMK